MKLYDNCVYAILDEDKLLAADKGVNPSDQIAEGKPWSAVTKWLEDATARGERVPVIFADAKFVHRWLGWAVLAEVKLASEGSPRTLYRFQSLRPPLSQARSEFRLLAADRPLAESHIRSYVQFRTPSFLRERARTEGPLLAEWLQLPDSVKHVFESSFDDPAIRTEAMSTLRRAVDIVRTESSDNWQLLLTPGRIRLFVGDTVVVDLGNATNEFKFHAGPDSTDDETDSELALAALFQKYEVGFRASVKSLKAIPVGESKHCPVVLDFLGEQAPVLVAGGETLEHDDVPDAFDPTDMRDGRLRVLSTLIRRRGQSAFRQQLLRAYGGKCAISGWAVEDVLDAAHILPYRGDHTNHVTNGLLLRTDLHTLFDLNLLWIEPTDLTIHLDPRLAESPYRYLHGSKLTLPNDTNEQPSRECLRERLTQLRNESSS